MLFCIQGSDEQLFVGLLVCWLSAIMYALFEPFKTSADNAMALLGEVTRACF